MTAEDTDIIPGRTFLSDFQKEKFEYYFKNFFDSDGDGFITYADFKPLQQRILKFTGWSPNSGWATLIEELHREFYECLQEKTKSKGKVAVEQWIDMWGRFTLGSMGMSDFPYWVQLLPKLMFAIIDQDKDGIIDYNELTSYYKSFISIEESRLKEMTDTAYSAMTAGGKYVLDQDLYDMIFANFVLGKNIHGPGKYIFGSYAVHKMKPEPFKITIPKDDEEDTKPLLSPSRSGVKSMLRPRSFENLGKLLQQ